MQERRKDYPEELIRRTVHETLITLGFKVNEPFEVQADVAYLHKLRKGSEKISWAVKSSVVTVVISGILTVLWLGIKAALGKG